jgi:two-component system, OmpR family, response regulator
LEHGNEAPQRLSPKENALLALLCQHHNDVLPRKTALLKIWKDDSYFATRSMDVYIAKLRKRLKKDLNLEIENIHGEGYRLLDK